MRAVKAGRRLIWICLAISVCGALTGCGQEDEARQSKAAETSVQQSIPQQREISSHTLIQDQTFETELAPLGKVTFASYEPDVSKNLFSDVVFEVQKDGRTIETLDGMYDNNIRSNDFFRQVEAVSFPDYNRDGFQDIITICSYQPASADADTPETRYSEARIYSGNAQGTFTLERELTDAANETVAFKSVRTILGFMGAGRENGDSDMSGWKQAYIKHLQKPDDNRWEGYGLIYVNNDEIPELVEVGNCEAAGCGIVSYADELANEIILSRRSFSYIERGSLLCNSDGIMDLYYDLVYRMENQYLTRIASGYYGAYDDSVERDANGRLAYVYEWEGKRMGQKEYEQALNAVYPTDRAVPGYDWEKLMTREEVIHAIETLQVQNKPNVEHGETDHGLGELAGTWRMNPIKTEASNEVSLQGQFGTGIHEGSEMILSENGDFSYYIGISRGGKGTWRLDKTHITAEFMAYEAHSMEEREGMLTVEMDVETGEDGETTIRMTDLDGYIIVWSRL